MSSLSGYWLKWIFRRAKKDLCIYSIDRNDRHCRIEHPDFVQGEKQMPIGKYIERVRGEQRKNKAYF